MEAPTNTQTVGQLYTTIPNDPRWVTLYTQLIRSVFLQILFSIEALAPNATGVVKSPNLQALDPTFYPNVATYIEKGADITLYTADIIFFNVNSFQYFSQAYAGLASPNFILNEVVNVLKAVLNMEISQLVNLPAEPSDSQWIALNQIINPPAPTVTA